MVPCTRTAHDSHLVVFLYHCVHLKSRIMGGVHTRTRREKDVSFGPMLGKKEKEKKACHWRSHVPQCPLTHPHTCMYDSWETDHGQGKKKKGEWAMTWRTCAKWMTDIQHPSPHTHSSAILLNWFVQPEVPPDLVLNHCAAQRFSG